MKDVWAEMTPQEQWTRLDLEHPVIFFVVRINFSFNAALESLVSIVVDTVNKIRGERILMEFFLGYGRSLHVLLRAWSQHFSIVNKFG